MLSNRLKPRGYELITTADGASGIAMAKSEAPELILMDLNLPMMGGDAALTSASNTRQISIALCALDGR